MESEASENNVEEPLPHPPIEDQVLEVNLGIPDNPCPTIVNVHIKGKELEEFVYFLLEFVDCFAWAYAKMPGLDSEIAMHKLSQKISSQ